MYHPLGSVGTCIMRPLLQDLELGVEHLRVSDSKNGAHLTLGVTILYSDLYQLMQNDQKLWKMIIFFI